MTKNQPQATPEEEGLAETAELDKEKAHYAEMNEKADEHSKQGKVG